MSLPSFTSSVVVDVEGDVTRSRWTGTFQVKRVVTHQDRFDIEKFFKIYLPDAKDASDTIRNRATALAELRVRVVSGPSWWEGTAYGLESVDVSHIYDLLSKCAEATAQWHKELAEQVQIKPQTQDGNAS